MMACWEERKFKDVCDIVKGKKARATTQQKLDGYIPYVLIESFSKTYRQFTSELNLPQCREDDVLMVMDGASSGFVATGLSGAIGSTLARIRPKAGDIYPKFLYFWLKTKYDLLSRRTSGSAIPHVDKVLLKESKIPMPPLDIQRQLARILEDSEDLMEKREKANRITSQIIQSIFLKMFGNENPQNKIGDISLHVSSGSTPLGGEKTYVKEGITFIRSQNVLMNTLSLENATPISEKTHNEMKRTWVKNGDILLNITGASLGRVAVYKGLDDKANVNQHVCIIRADPNKAIPEYVSLYLSSRRAQKQIWTIQAGASRQALNYEQVRSLDIYIPSIDQQKEFVAVAKHIETLRDKQAQSAEEIDELFQSLMYKAFRGELTLGNA
ncbi:restriction endonuclease subunit S [Candidatus Bathyarchaeota archaeon]|nr:restriction endonuclease subunit S [Candidatus Bathyarchaeota archaeon]